MLSLVLADLVSGLAVPTESLSFELPARAWPKRSGWDLSHLAARYLLMQRGLAIACSTVTVCLQCWLASWLAGWLAFSLAARSGSHLFPHQLFSAIYGNPDIFRTLLYQATSAEQRQPWCTTLRPSIRRCIMLAVICREHSLSFKWILFAAICIYLHWSIALAICCINVEYVFLVYDM